ncbi:MAG: 5'-nucleotidase C-terminal domain-containing protein, partial [Verrucomicrobiota bacterium]
YENRIVTATLTGEQLIALLEEAFTNGFGRRRLVGFELEVEYDRELKKQRVLEAKAPDGSPVDPAKSYRIAFNSYDAQSGGRSMLLLRELLLKPSSKTHYFSVDTREALTDLFLDKEVVTAALIEELTGA